jgi:hypothetical protein
MVCGVRGGLEGGHRRPSYHSDAICVCSEPLFTNFGVLVPRGETKEPKFDQREPKFDQREHLVS